MYYIVDLTTGERLWKCANMVVLTKIARRYAKAGYDFETLARFNCESGIYTPLSEVYKKMLGKQNFLLTNSREYDIIDTTKRRKELKSWRERLSSKLTTKLCANRIFGN